MTLTSVRLVTDSWCYIQCTDVFILPAFLQTYYNKILSKFVPFIFQFISQLIMSNHVYSNDFFCFVSSMKSSTQECKLEQIYAKECNKPFFFFKQNIHNICMLCRLYHYILVIDYFRIFFLILKNKLNLKHNHVLGLFLLLVQLRISCKRTSRQKGEIQKCVKWILIQ